MEIKAGDRVEYKDWMSNEYKEGVAIAVCQIKDHQDKNMIDRSFALVEYNPTCYPDMIMLEDLTKKVQ